MKQRHGVLICGAYGHGNLGDDAILEAIVQEIRAIDPSIPIWALSRRPGETAERLGIKAVHRFNLFGMIKVMRKTRLYLSGGGSLIQDVTSRRSLWYYLTNIKLAKRFGNIVCMYGCGIGPVFRKGSRKRVAKVLNSHVDTITLREDSSLEELKRLGVSVPEIVLAADPVLSLASAPDGEIENMLHQLGLRPGERYLCLALRGWKGFSKKAPVIAAAANRAYELHGLTPVFMAINHRNDGIAADTVASHLTVPYHIVREPLPSGISIGLMSRMSVVVAMRLHGLVFAASRGVPLVGIDYDPKVTAFLRYVGQEMYTPFADLDEDTLNSFIDRAAKGGGVFAEDAERLAQLERKNFDTAKRLYLSRERPSTCGKTQIAIFQNDFRVGGIQKSLVNVLNSIDYNHCEVDLFLYDHGNFFELSEYSGLNVHYVKPFPYINRLIYFRILRKISKPPATDKKYHVSVDFNSYRNECAIGALGIPADKRVIWIHNDVEVKLRDEPRYRVLWHFFKKKYSYADELCAVSPGIIEGFRRVSGVKDKKITPIQNFINTEEIFRKAEEPCAFQIDPSCYNLCSVGRICHQKGFDILMEYLAEAIPHRPDLRLYLIGDGPDREKLETQIAKLGLSGIVTLTGYQSNPFSIMNAADAFILTSRYEGQGMVIWEALSLGLEIFIPQHLEKYNPGIFGKNDLIEALKTAEKREKIRNPLTEYNENIRKSIYNVFGINGEI